MVLQLEDCVDIVKILYPQYDFFFLFDPLWGNDKQREDGLNVNVMAKSFDGKQRILRIRKIKTHLGFLGEHPRILNPGDTQKMVFSDDNTGPFWMSREEEISQKYDFATGKTKTRNLTKSELLAALKENIGLEIPPGTVVKIKMRGNLYFSQI